jgi:hypothetical protein
MAVCPRVSVPSVRRRLKLCQMSQITLPLLRPPLVTRLILRTHQAIGTAATVGRQIQIAAAPPDRLLHRPAPCFRGLKSPTLVVGIRQEAAEFTAMHTRARDSARPCPIAWRLQCFGDADAQVLQGCRAQALYAATACWGTGPLRLRAAGTRTASGS